MHAHRATARTRSGQGPPRNGSGPAAGLAPPFVRQELADGADVLVDAGLGRGVHRRDRDGEVRRHGGDVHHLGAAHTCLTFLNSKNMLFLNASLFGRLEDGAEEVRGRHWWVAKGCPARR
jgi:hypothetical protein